MVRKGGNSLTVPNSLPPLFRWLSSFLVVVLILGPGTTRADAAPAGPPTVEVLSLTAGASLEREIRGGETASLELDLAARTFVFLEISQRSMRLSFRLLDPAGGEVASGEGGENPGFQLLMGITQGAGSYRLDVSADGEPRVAGKFRLAARELRPAVAGDEVRVKAARLLSKGRHLLYQGSREAAAPLAESVSLWKSAGDVRGEVEVLSSLADFQSRQGDKLAALGTNERALQLSRESGLSEREAWALSNRGILYLQLARFDEAVKCYHDLVEVWSRVGGPYEKAFAFEGLGNAYLYKGDPERAREAFQQALSFAEECGDLERRARITLGLGSVQFVGGYYNEALRTFEEALALSRVSGDTESERATEVNLSVLYQKQGQFQKAVDMTLRQIDRGHSGELGPQYRNLGSLYLELGDPEKALESYELCEKEFQKARQPDGVVDALIGIGSVRQRTGDPRGALAIFEEAKRVAPEKSWKVYHYLGFAQLEAGQPAEALASLKQALETARASHIRLNEAATLLALGCVYKALGKPDLAADHFGQAIQLGNAMEAPAIVTPGLLKRALLYREQGRLKEALSDASAAREIVESTRQNISGQDLKLSFFAERRKLYEFSIDLLTELARLHPEGDYQAMALEVSEGSRARGLLDLLAEGRIDVRQGLTPELRQREERLAYELSRVQLELRTGNPAPERTQNLQAEIGRLDREREQLEADIRGQNQRYAAVRYPRPLTLREIQSTVLDDQTALLEFALGEKRSALFVVTRREIHTYELPPADKIDPQVRRLRNALEKASFLTRGEYMDSAFLLYQDLVAPAAGALAGIPNLLIIPDGSLYYVPFEALLAEPAGDRSYQNLPYLLQRYSIAYAPSASVLAGLLEPRKEPGPEGRKQVVAFAPFAGPGTGAATRGGPAQKASSPPPVPAASHWSFDPLPASLREVSGIAGLYPGEALSFSGSEADEGTVKNNPAVSKARRLHFATHARIDERFPENSALVFAARGTQEDELLQVHEIFNLKLSADLAVLSACQTALGKEVTGEGLVGLTRAFFYAGVPSLVVSLWNVVDGATPDFMIDFYKNLDQLNDKARALRQAKMSMITDTSHSHPSYWAPFILIGAPH